MPRLLAVVNEPLGMLAPDAVATYAAMLKAVEKPCPNDPPCEHSEDDHDPCAGSPVTEPVSGEDLTDLGDAIIRAERLAEGGKP